MTVTVYTKPDCVQCEWTKRHLDKLDVPYTLIDVDAVPLARDELTDLGYTSGATPVVVVDDGRGTRHWQGFKIDMIRGLTNERKRVTS